ncbi:hypothetical protein K8S19_08690 [bacterium]|nr:hypothetical protein [bacterium]
MKRIIVFVVGIVLICNPMLVLAETKKNETEEISITEVKLFDMQTLSILEMYPNGSIGKMRKYINQVRPFDEELYQELDPMIDALEVENIFFWISYSLFAVGFAVFIATANTDEGTPSWILAPFSVGVIGAFFFRITKDDIMRIIHKYNELLAQEKEFCKLELSTLKLIELKYSF